MTAIGLDKLPTDAGTIRLAKHFGDELRLCERVGFPGGYDDIHMILRRAAISGRVEVDGEIADHFADIMNADGDTNLAVVALDAGSFAALKNHWMRCRYERPYERFRT